MKNLTQAYSTVLNGEKFFYSISRNKTPFNNYKNHLAHQDVLEVDQISTQEGFDSYFKNFILENSEELCALGMGIMVERSQLFDDVIFFNLVEKID